MALPLHEALRLFTPEGERDWVDHWAPRYAEEHIKSPGSVPTGDGMVPRTGSEVGAWLRGERRIGWEPDQPLRAS